jgi:hypothetical protein
MQGSQEVPAVFVRFCQWFHQDVLRHYRSFDQAISAFVDLLDEAEKVTLKAYLEDLIASDATDDELLNLWQDHGSEWGSTRIRRLFADWATMIGGSEEPPHD